MDDDVWSWNVGAECEDTSAGEFTLEGARRCIISLLHSHASSSPSESYQEDQRVEKKVMMMMMMEILRLVINTNFLPNVTLFIEKKDVDDGDVMDNVVTGVGAGSTPVSYVSVYIIPVRCARNR